MSPYKLAIDLTIQIIDKRVRYYRNLIIFVALVAIGSIVGTVIAGQVQTLFILTILIPLCGLFFFLDRVLLSRWKSQIFKIWINKELDLRSFCDAVSAIQFLPTVTLQSMLASLPVGNNVVVEQEIASTTRDSISTVVMIIHRCQSDIIAFKTIGFAIAACTIFGAIVLGRWYPLLGFILILPLPLLQQWIKRKRLGLAREKIIAIRFKDDFCYGTYFEYVDSLDWRPISPSDKTRFLADLDPRASLDPKSNAKQ